MSATWSIWPSELGFSDIRLQLQIEVKVQTPRSWDSYLRTVPNPKVPSLGEAIEQALEPEERATSSQPVSARWSSKGKGRTRSAVAYLSTTKQAAG